MKSHVLSLLFMAVILLAVRPNVDAAIKDSQNGNLPLTIVEAACTKHKIVTELSVEADACTHCMAKGEAGLPHGTRVYAYDQYVITDHGRESHFPVISTVDCLPNGWRLTDPVSHRISTFTQAASVEREHAFMWEFVRPGQPMPWRLRLDLRNRTAYFLKQI